MTTKTHKIPFKTKSVSPMITSFYMWITIRGDQDHLDALQALIPSVMGTRGDGKDIKRAAIFTEFAYYCAEKADAYAKHAQRAGYAKHLKKGEKSAAWHAAREARSYAVEGKDFSNYVQYDTYSSQNARRVSECAEDAANHALFAAVYSSSASSPRYAAIKKEIYDEAVRALIKAVNVKAVKAKKKK